MEKGLNKYPFIVQVIAMPITWVIAILKVLIVIPIFVIAKCNAIMNSL
jgi:hypothetical protein